LEGLPEGTRQNGYEDFVVQDLKDGIVYYCGGTRTTPSSNTFWSGQGLRLTI
jgi:hypothetical protein